MACKIIAFAAVIAVVQAGVIAPVPAPVVAATRLEEYDPNPQYTFAYDVQDDLTGDFKNQYETRNGDIVQGRYSFIEADGSRRIVDYTADPLNGFNAIVQRQPGVVSVPTRVVASPTRIVAPAQVVAPLRVSAPARVVASARVASPARVVAPARFISVKAAAPVVAAPVVATKVAQPVVAAPVAEKVIAAPGFARFISPAAPLAAPVARYTPEVLNTGFARFIQAPTPVVAAAPVAKVAAPLTYPASIAYSAPFPAPYTKVVTPFGYSAAYNTFF